MKTEDLVLQEKGRLLGIDYGRVRVGLALSDLSQTLASACGTLANGRSEKKRAALLQELAALCRRETVTAIVIGLPRRTDLRPGEMEAEVRLFARDLALQTGLETHLLDERFTSRLALQYLRDVGVGAREARGVVDEKAAELILQDFLDRQRDDRA